MDTISGLPAHPLLVHIPVVLIPIAAIGAVLMAIKPAWHHRYRWAVLVLGVVGCVGTVLAASAGEELEGALRRAGEANTWESHAEAGETARTLAIVFLVALLAFVLVPWFLERRSKASAAESQQRLPKWIAPLLAVVAIGAGATSVVTIVDAGHSGATSVWQEDAPAEGGG